MQPFNELITLKPEKSSVNVWIGQRGVRAHCHFDGFHNFYAQLVGTKKFIVYPPRAWNTTYVYPFLHPHHGQAQVRRDAIDAQLYRNAAGEGLASLAIELVLQPGELLYLPPLWFHETEALEESISVNAWTEPQEAVDTEQAFAAVANGMQGSGGLGYMPAVLALLIQEIVGTCGGNSHGSPRRFVTELVAVRYTYRLKRLQGSATNEKGEGHRIYTGAIVCRSTPGSSNLVAPTARIQSQLDDTVGSTCARMGSVPEDTRPLWLGNLIEYIAAHVGGAEQAAAFLRHIAPCLNGG